MVDPRQRRVETAHESQHAAFAGDITTVFASGSTKVLSESIADTVGHPEQEHIEFPAELYDAAHSSELAFLLSIALVLDQSKRTIDRQFSLLQEQLGSERTEIIRRYYDELSTSSGEYRLPLLEITFPALKRRPMPELAFLVELTNRLIEVDGDIDLYEFCFYRIMMSSLGQAIDPTGTHGVRRSRRQELQSAATELLRILADHGHDSDQERIAAFAAGIATLGPWAHGAKYESDRECSVAKLNNSLDVLLGLNSKGQESLLRAVSATAAHDGQISVAEAELIRAVCATLNYPLPPILVHR